MQALFLLHVGFKAFSSHIKETWSLTSAICEDIFFQLNLIRLQAELIDIIFVLLDLQLTLSLILCNRMLVSVFLCSLGGIIYCQLVFLGRQ